MSRGVLPKQRTSFAGRELELEQLRAWLSSGAQLVVIKGSAGVGKTRLACQFARDEQREHPPRGGVWFCDVSRARTTEDLCLAVAAVLGLQIPEADASAIARVLARRNELLLVLDNFEQLEPHASSALDTWVERTEHATFVVTSRRRLNIAGEQVLELGPLPFPRSAADADRGLDFPAVRLFVERASFAQPGYAAADRAELGRVGEIVRSLEGLPLAIELCAARMKLLGSEQLLSRLERGRALRGALDGSWDLLDAGAQQTLAACSIFAGGFEIDAAQSILATDGERTVLDVLELLADHSLLATEDASGLDGERRFVLSEVVREYTSERLARDPTWAGEVAKRHAHFYARYCEKLAGTGDRARLALEIDNALVAIDGLTSSQLPADVEVALELALAIEPALYTDPIARQVALLDRVLDPILASAEERSAYSTEIRALMSQALVLRGWSTIVSGDAEKGARDLDAAVSFATTAAAKIRALARRGVAFLMFGERERGLGCLAEAQERANEIGDSDHDRRALADYHTDLGIFRQQQGDFEQARRELEQALELWRNVQSRRNEGLTLANLGDCALEVGAIDEALRYYDRAIRAFTDVGDRRLEANVLSNSGAALVERGALDDARTTLERALALHRELGYRYYEAITLAYFAYAALADEKPAEARDRALAALELFEDPRCDALTRALLAVALFETGEAEKAERELDRAERELTKIGRPADAIYTLLMRALGQVIQTGGTEATTRAGQALAAARRSDPSYDVRFAARQLERVLSRPSPAPLAPSSARTPVIGNQLVIGPDGRWFRWQEQCVEFRRQAALRSILETLARSRVENAGTPLGLEELVGSGWPGERIGMDSQKNRLYVAMSQLRKLGLRGLILSRDDGWLLDPGVDVVFSSELAPCTHSLVAGAGAGAGAGAAGSGASR